MLLDYLNWGEVERIKKLLNVFNWGADMNSRVLYTTTGWKIINAFYERRSLKRKSLKKGDVIKVWYKYPEDYFKIKINEYEKRLSCRGKLK